MRVRSSEWRGGDGGGVSKRLVASCLRLDAGFRDWDAASGVGSGSEGWSSDGRPKAERPSTVLNFVVLERDTECARLLLGIE